MERFKILYRIISYSLLIVQLGFLSIMIYKVAKRYLDHDYANRDNLITISADYSGILQMMLFGTFAFMITWAILTPFAIISQRQEKVKDYRDVVPGFVAF